jgi:hypothetical protein
MFVHGIFFPYKKNFFYLTFIFKATSAILKCFFYIFQQRNLHMYVPFKGQKFKILKNNHN